jgi:hypothetical protein
MIQAHGLKHLNHFTGDHPYCVCEVKSHAGPAKAETKPVTSGDTLNPVWDEAFEIDPWQEGESLEFTIYDQGLIGAKTEGKALLPAESFFPNGFHGMLPISDLPESFLQVEVQILKSETPITYAAPFTVNNNAMTSSACTYPGTPSAVYRTPNYVAHPMTYANPTMYSAPVPCASAMSAAKAGTSTIGAAPPNYSMQSQLPVVQMGPQRLGISILEAHGLQHLNHFTGDHPYVTCEIKHSDKARSTRIETKPVTQGDMQNPFWGETHYLNSWHPGEPLEFSIYDKGLMGSKTEGKAVLPAELFSAQGFTGMIPISGLPHAVLHVIVRPLGSDHSAQDEGATKSRKLKTKHKSRGCC